MRQSQKNCTAVSITAPAFKRFSITLVFFIAHCTLGFSQEKYGIFYLSGDKIEKVGTTSTVLDSKAIGSKLLGTDFIHLPANSFIILSNTAGKSVKVMGASKTQVQQVFEDDKLGTAFGAVSKYLAFVWGEFTQEKTSLDDYSQRYMRSKGLVSRSGCLQTKGMFPLHSGSLLPDTVLTFNWDNPTKAAYTFQIYGSADGTDLLYERQLVDSTTKLYDKEIIKIATQKPIYWALSKGPLKGCKNKLQIFDSTQTQNFDSKYKSILTDLVHGEPLNTLAKAAFYEENQLLDAAYAEYRTAQDIAPENPLVGQSFSLFLARIGKHKTEKQAK